MKVRPALLIVIMLIIFPSCSRNRTSAYQESKALIDTFVTVTVVSESADKAEKAVSAAFTTIEDFGGLINFFSAESELSLINKNAGIKETSVSHDTFDVIEKSLYVAEKSGGAFDPTIGPVVRLWDFHQKIKPSDAEIKRNLVLVNYRDVVINREKSTVFLRRKGMLLDLGGIAKGYAADLAFATLKRYGITAGIVAVGGEIRAFGLRPDGKPWNVGIKNPRQSNQKDEILGTLRLSNKTISTSGDYERYFISEGRRFHHILDPKTGYPAGLSRSVSIITEKGVFTDGFSTAIFVLGPENGLRVIREINRDFEMDAIIIDYQGSIHETDRIKGTVTYEKNN